MQKDVSKKTSALDRERFEVACLRQDIIDEYEQKSRELLDYLFKLETEFKIQQGEFEEREAILRHENKVLKDELNRGSKIAKRTLFTKRQKYHQLDCQDVESTSRILKDETSEHEWNYQLEHKRAEVNRFQHSPCMSKIIFVFFCKTYINDLREVLANDGNIV